ncbi:MAG: hypothetical protein ACKVON_17615 [Beijerinckiaceae bacterium]
MNYSKIVNFGLYRHPLTHSPPTAKRHLVPRLEQRFQRAHGAFLHENELVLLECTGTAAEPGGNCLINQ